MCDPSKLVCLLAPDSRPAPECGAATRNAVSAFLAGLGPNDCSSFPLDRVPPQQAPLVPHCVLRGADGVWACKVGTHPLVYVLSPLSDSRHHFLCLDVKTATPYLCRSMVMTPRSCPSFRHQCRPRPARPRPPDGTSRPPSYTNTPAQTDSPGLRLAPWPQPPRATPLHVVALVCEEAGPISAAHNPKLALAHRRGRTGEVKGCCFPTAGLSVSGKEDPQ